MAKERLLEGESGMAFFLLVSELEFEHTKNLYRLDTPQGSWEGKILAVVLVVLENLVVPKVQVMGVEGYEVLKQPLHQLDLFKVGLVLVLMVVNPFYKRK